MTPKNSTLAAGVALLLLSGCAGTNTAYVDPNSSKTLVTLGTMGVQDWNKLTDDTVQKLLDEFINSGNPINGSGPGGKAIFALSLIQNLTGKQVDSRELTGRVRTALNRTGKVITEVSSDDPAAAEEKRRRAFLSGGEIARPDYTLSGSIKENIERNGNVRQVTYVCHLSLANRDALAVWEGDTIIVKQGKQSAAGW